MFDGLRNWLAIRSEMRAQRTRRAFRQFLDAQAVEEQLQIVFRLLGAGEAAEASTVFDRIERTYPDGLLGNPNAVHLLLQLGRIDEAEMLVDRNQRRDPDDRRFAELYGGVADHRDDLVERLRRWRAFRRRYPAFPNAFIHEAHALQAAGDLEGAEAVLAQGVRTVPDDVVVAIEFARCADARQDWEASLQRWMTIRDVHDRHLASVMMARALVALGRPAEAAETLAEGRRRHPNDAECIEEQARLAASQGDLVAAAGYWTEVVRDFPYRPGAYVDGAQALLAAGDPAAAEAMVAAAVGRTPDDRNLNAWYADLAAARGDWAAAAARWAAWRAVAPDDRVAVAREAQALRQLGEAERARALLEEAAARVPGDADISQALAELAEGRGDWAAAAQAWQGVLAVAGDRWWAYAGLARCFVRAGAFDAAEQVLTAGLQARPDEPALAHDHAAVAAAAGRAEEAGARWAAALARFPDNAALVRGHAAWLREQDRGGEATQLLWDALARAPDTQEYRHDLAQLAAQSGDWPAAEALWRDVIGRAPALGWAYHGLIQSLREQGRAAEVPAVLDAAIAACPGDQGLAAARAAAAEQPGG